MSVTAIATRSCPPVATEVTPTPALSFQELNARQRRFSAAVTALGPDLEIALALPEHECVHGQLPDDEWWHPECHCWDPADGLPHLDCELRRRRGRQRMAEGLPVEPKWVDADGNRVDRYGKPLPEQLPPNVVRLSRRPMLASRAVPNGPVAA